MARIAAKRIAAWNPARDVWETGTTGLFCEHLDVFSGTWPSSGMTRGGVAYALRTSGRRTAATGSSSSRLLPTPRTSDTNGAGAHGQGGPDLRTAVTLLLTPRASDGTNGGPNQAGIVRGLDAPERGSPHAPDADSDAVRVESVALAGSSGAPEPGWHGEAPPDSDGDGLTRLGRVHAGERDPDGRGRECPTRDDAEPTAWGPYAPAIGRWAAALGRPAPPPTELGPKGAPRLSSRFVEWLMGLPAGHVTDVPGISRSDQLKALGNGVVPAQAAAATRRWLNDYADA